MTEPRYRLTGNVRKGNEAAPMPELRYKLTGATAAPQGGGRGGVGEDVWNLAKSMGLWLCTLKNAFLMKLVELVLNS